MPETIHFSVNTKLTRLLAETYRSSEAAIKELVDNAWDADASNVWITLPSPFSSESLVVRDDGAGMTAPELRSEYLNIASDKRTRTGERTKRLNRRVKGRKGIGKFAGLMIAAQMTVVSSARGRRCTLIIDKKQLIEYQADLEAVPLPFTEDDTENDEKGTTITLRFLDDRLNFPTADRLREVLILEYGRDDAFKVFVDGSPLSIQDVPGHATKDRVRLPSAGDVSLDFTIADGKRLPRAPGIVVKIDGKAVGKPSFLGLEEDEDIPPGLVRRLYGEVNLVDLDNIVTADWGAIIENSKVYEEVQDFARKRIKEELRAACDSEMRQQQARIQKKIDQRLKKLPEYRRAYAQKSLHRILTRFYGDTDERIETIIDVALDAMEHDEYWVVLNEIKAASNRDVEAFSESLKQFGLLEIANILSQAQRRRIFLDYLDNLIQNQDTLEKEAHKALEENLWVLGRKYSMMTSNSTLRNIAKKYCEDKFVRMGSARRPDLLLAQDYNDSYLLIEFKRPSHDITRDDVAQAEKYRDELSSKLSPAKSMDIMLIGRGRLASIDARNILSNIVILSYASIISAARNELDWLLNSLSRA